MLWRNTADIEQQLVRTRPGLTQPSVSFEALDQFSSENYQQLVTSMISDLSSAVLGNSHVAEIPLLKLSTGGCDNKSSRVFQESSGSLWEPVENSLSKHTSRQRAAVPSPSNFSISAVEPLHYLGIAPTVQSAQLLQDFLKIVSKYAMSIDGNASPNFYNDYWVPWSVKSPLLAHLGILTAAIWQAEAQKIPSGQSPIALHYKVKSIELLNKMLENRNSATSTEAIAAVVSLLVNEWFWLNRDIVQRHMAGLKVMIRLRGGLDELGTNGFPRKLVLHNDYNVACSYEIEPTFLHDVSARPEHPVEMSIPFVVSEREFGSCAEHLQIGKETAAILDDMRFLFLALIKHVEDDTREEEQRRLITTAKWVRDRIMSLPEGSEVDSPLASDHIYRSCRIAALIYSKAIVERTPLSRVCTPQYLNLLWGSMWQVKLSRWKQTPGIFFFVLASVLSAAEDAPHGRFTKAMFRTTTSFIGLDYFELIDAALMALVKLQRWLRTGGGGNM
ncbi:hypothetical protein N431DRAFT_366674 [Stipitochalara longipes BDJ]|nr:hypothetical protein N431DRAFT_366674 [Stipitochalara longipes BDJ]